MKVSVLSGICVKNDAISQAVRSSIRKLDSALGAESRLFTAACDFPEVDSKVVHHPHRLANDPWFLQSELVVAHFGIYYELFDVLPLVPSNAKIVCIFHNITPGHLMGASSSLSDKSFEQLCNMQWADYVICDSPTNLEVLREAGVNTPASVVPIEVPLPQKVADKPSSRGERPLLLYVGRLVESKGVLDLVEAAAYVLGDDARIEFDLVLAGNLAMSDPAVVRAIELVLETLNHAYGDRFRGRIEGSPSDQRRDELLEAADIFVIPSYHEGFGVPVVEAYGFGCRVIGNDNSNLPNVISDLGTLVPTGDVTALAAAINADLKVVSSAQWAKGGGLQDHISRARAYASQFTPGNVIREFERTIRGVIE